MKAKEWIVTYFDIGNDIISSCVIKAPTIMDAQKKASITMPENCEDWSIKLRE